MKKESKSLETHIKKGLTKHQAINAVEGAGSVKAPGKKRKKKGKTSFGPIVGGRGK